MDLLLGVLVAPESAVAIIGAITALVVALTAMLVQLGKLRQEVNGRLTQLIAEATDAARKQGELEGRDFMHKLLRDGHPPLRGNDP